MSSAAVLVVSRETGPSTSAQTSFIWTSQSLCSFANRLGLVVHPLSTPHLLIVRISSRFAVSRNSFIVCSPPLRALLERDADASPPFEGNRWSVPRPDR